MQDNRKIPAIVNQKGTDTQVTHHTLTKCSKCNTFHVTSDLVHDFMNFNAQKII